MTRPIDTYTTKVNQACLITSPSSRKKIIEGIIMDARKDRSIPPLTLCAFLQDHARLIKEL